MFWENPPQFSREGTREAFGEVALGMFALAIVLALIRPASIRLMTMEGRRDRMTVDQARRFHTRGLMVITAVAVVSLVLYGLLS